MQTDEIHFGWEKKYGNLEKYLGGLNRNFFLVADPKMVQTIVSQAYDFPKPERFVASAKAFVGYGLALVDGDIHKRQRKMMTPAFTHSNIKVSVWFSLAAKIYFGLTNGFLFLHHLGYDTNV